MVHAIFPWIEEADRARVQRQEANRLTIDIALFQFLRTLRFFRRILVQDMAVLFARNPSALIFQYHPFNTTVFREFAAAAPAVIEEAERKAQLALKNLPENIARTFQGAVATVDIAMQQDRALNDSRYEHLMQSFDALKTFIDESLNGTAPRRKRQSSHGASTFRHGQSQISSADAHFF